MKSEINLTNEKSGKTLRGKNSSWKFHSTWLAILLLTVLLWQCKKDTFLEKPGVCPEVLSTDPTDLETNVLLNQIISVTFNVPMNPATIIPAAFSLTSPGSKGDFISGEAAPEAVVSGTMTYDAANNKMSFVPTTQLEGSTTYTGTVAKSVGDLHGNYLQADYAWTFITGALPTVISTVPVNNATNVAFNSKVTATFSEAMDPLTITSSTFTLMQGLNPVAGTVTYAGLIATFTPTENLAVSTVYTATLTTGAKNLSGFGLGANYTWTFTTGTGPTVISTVPVNNAINVPFNSKVTATFSEAMDPSTITSGTFTLYQGLNPVSGTVTYSGIIATFTPTANLTASTLYTATITNGAKNLTGNPMGANYIWTFATGTAPDITPPTVVSTVPVDAATGVAFNTKVTATFSEAMDPLTIIPATFTLKQGVTPVAGTLTYIGLVATFVPAANLTASTVYTATMNTAAKDLAGNAMAANYVWTFTTGAAADVTPPTVISTIPLDAATGVAFNTKVTATFSEAMDPLTILPATFTLKQGATSVAGSVTYVGLVATFTPAANLAPSTLYTATVTTGAKDLAGNAMAANYVWTFTTGATADVTPPTVISVVPLNGAIGVAVNIHPTATFSETMDLLTITNATFTLKLGAATVPGNVTYSGLVATFTPTVNLLNGTLYTATITTGAKDLAGNPLAVDYVWTFSTVVVVVPPLGPGAVNLGTAANFAAIGKAGISTTGVSSITGDIGVSPAAATAITGFGLIMDVSNTFSTTPIVIGKVYASDYTPPTPAYMTQAISDMETALTAAMGMVTSPIVDLGAGNISGMTLVAGLYKFNTGLLITNAGVTLTGGPDDTWVFQIASDFTVNNTAIITLAGGAQAKNIFWVTSTQALIGSTVDFKGNILAQTLISLNTGAKVLGRLLSQTAVTLNAATVIKP